eukprot:366551-Chlamydomonas_euryale.AAC.37
MRDREHALHAEDVRALSAQQVAHPLLEQLKVHLARLPDADAAHRVVMLVLPVGVQETRVHLQCLLEVKPADVQHVVD